MDINVYFEPSYIDTKLDEQFFELFAIIDGIGESCTDEAGANSSRTEDGNGLQGPEAVVSSGWTPPPPKPSRSKSSSRTWIGIGTSHHPSSGSLDLTNERNDRRGGRGGQQNQDNL